tara:strand:+ start:1464 stop:1640 length:177 start_codon:yes stop_codon:yes gene_type:complete
MRRKVIKNCDQFKLNIPIALVRKLNLEEHSTVRFIEANTKHGKGFVVVKDQEEVLELP